MLRWLLPLTLLAALLSPTRAYAPDHKQLRRVAVVVYDEPTFRVPVVVR